MSKGSVGLGLATRRMSVANFQERKTGKSLSFFLTLSFSILMFNAFAGGTVEKFKHMAVDKTSGIIELANIPANFVQERIAAVQMILSVRENNQQLAAENARLLEWYQTANRLDSENKALRELLHMKDDDAMAFQSGQIISDAKTQYSQTILVKLGQKDGIEKGQGVLTYEGLIGRVIEAGQTTARVLLMNDINSRIPVTVEGTQDRAILAGRNGGDPVLDHLPEDHGIIAGQKIVTSGHGGVFPYGVPVGETYLTDTNEIAVRPYANPNRSSHVQVVNYGVPAGSARRSVASSSSSVLR